MDGSFNPQATGDRSSDSLHSDCPVLSPPLSHLWGDCGENKETAGPQEVPANIFFPTSSSALQEFYCSHFVKSLENISSQSIFVAVCELLHVYSGTSEHLSIKDKSTHPNSYYTSTFLTSE